MLFFVFVGPASAINAARTTTVNGTDILQISFAFGLGIFVLACAIGHHSGGQMNCAVTLCLVITGDVPVLQGVLNLFAQILGSICAAFLLWAVYPLGMDATGSLGSNMLGNGYEWYNAFVGEILMTFLLCYVVTETALNPKSSKSTVELAIGCAVFLAHTSLIAVDGCSINPTRSIGPAIVASIRYETASDNDAHIAVRTQHPKGVHPEHIWYDHWVFWAGPLIGAILAGVLARIWWKDEEPEPEPEPEP